MIFERGFAGAFNPAGIEAVASIDVIPPEEAADEGALLTAAQKRGTSMIMVTHLISIEDTEVYHPPKSYTVNCKLGSNA